MVGGLYPRHTHHATSACLGVSPMWRASAAHRIDVNRSGSRPLSELDITSSIPYQASLPTKPSREKSKNREFSWLADLGADHRPIADG